MVQALAQIQTLILVMLTVMEKWIKFIGIMVLIVESQLYISLMAMEHLPMPQKLQELPLPYQEQFIAMEM
ncbi:hypothetical protein D3C87_1721020 [compost metagenome]